MQGKLIKSEIHGYILEDNKGNLIGSISNNDSVYKLSLKNCQEIENGYDLDELTREACDITDPLRLDSQKYKQDPYFKIGFNKGFKKALEILGDKKFSEEDMEKLMFATIEFTEQKEGETYPFLKSFIQSLQQTEWDVEICCYLGNGDKESDSFKDRFVTNTGIPKLDSYGCLILKKI